jgi:predicted metal-dependent hydrolase
MNRRKLGRTPVSREELRDEIMAWASRIGVEPRRVQVQRLTRKWASCSTAGRVTFAIDLLKEPPAFRDQVIVHELVHLIAPNHGKLFKSLVRAHVGRSGGDEALRCSIKE